MSKEMRNRLVGWIEETVRSHYAGKVALVCLYGSHINGTANERSDVDCYFVPKTQEGNLLARTFLLGGVGYDLFPMPWQRLEAIARLEQPLYSPQTEAFAAAFAAKNSLQLLISIQDTDLYFHCNYVIMNTL